MSEKIILLSIDWDYVTGDCIVADGTHCGYCGFPDRTRGGSIQWGWEERLSKLKKFQIPRSCPIYVAECHASIMEAIKILSSVPHVIDFDTHFDSYDKEGYVHCGNWVYHLRNLGGSVDSRPTAPVTKNASMVFICKSSPWTPKESDVEFFQLIKSFARKSRTKPIFIGHDKESLSADYKFITRRNSEVNF
jgi:hypothetical protein